MGGVSAVLLDALGTLVALEPPAPHLVAELALRGVAVTEVQAAVAMRAEIAFYQREHHRAGTPAALAALRRECALLVRAELGPPAAGARIEDVEAALLGAIRFAPFPEVPAALAALRRDGARLVVVSNWDVSLHAVLEATGLAPLVDAAISSAEAGSAKPAPAIFARALELVGATPADAVMVGDSVATDVAGAIAAGIAPALVVRAGPVPALPRGVRVLADLGGLPEWVRYRRLPRCPPAPRSTPAPPTAAPEPPRRAGR